MYRVLIVDDEPWSRMVVKSLGSWDKLNLEVVGEAEDGTQELKMIEALKPHIVITDMRMPGLEGDGLLKALNEKFPSLKIIIMSGYNDFAYMKQAILSRAVDYLLKPINPEELNTSLERCIAEIESMSPETSPIFTDLALLDKYLAYRQQLLGYLMQINRPEVIHVLDNLEKFLNSTPQVHQDYSVLTKISRDMALILNEFITENNMEYDKLWAGVKPEDKIKTGWSSVDMIIEDLKNFFLTVMDALAVIQKNKSHLDIDKVKTYIDSHFQEQIMLDSIAQHFFVSKEYLSRAFKASVNENVSDYITRKRMEKARELILEDKLEIKDIAYMCGYEDLAYFYRVFKKYFEFTPGKLREK